MDRPRDRPLAPSCAAADRLRTDPSSASAGGLPGINHRLMQAVLGAELRDRQLAPECLECYFRFEFSVVTLACRLGHLYSSLPKDEPSLSCCPIRGDPLWPSSGGPGAEMAPILAVNVSSAYATASVPLR